jgi:hypothetical protein
MSEPDIVGMIWAEVEAEGLLADLSTAERRKALDDALRLRPARIEDVSLRAHAAEMIRARRAEVMFPACRELFGTTAGMWRRIGALETIVAALQRAQAGVAP